MNNNLFDFNSEIKEKIKGWAKNVLAEMRSAFSLGTEGSKIKNEIGKYIVADTASGIYENNKLVVKAFSQMLEKLNYQREFGLISEDEYYEKLERLRDRYFAKGTQNWLKYTAQIYEYQKRALEDEKEGIIGLYDDIADYTSKKLGSIIEKQAKFSEKLKNAGGIFNKNTVTVGDTTMEYYSIRDMQADIERIKDYNELLREFSERVDKLGISTDTKNGFLSELMDADFEAALSFLQTVRGNTDGQVFDYLSTWAERNEIADAVAAKRFEADFSDGIDDSYEHMKEVLKKAGYEIPEGFFISGSLSAQKFGDAFIAEVETQMERIRAVIDAFNSEIASYSVTVGGNTYNTSNTSYNIQSAEANDTVEQIRRFETIKRLSGVT
ncbi:MAG: hypothetical protein IKR46_01500 [Clostridia bacterium]|nr:hypothetical protein [Clostridia bacterium]